MALFGFGKKKKKEQTENHEAGGFVGFVLLSEPSWDREQFIKDLKDDWSIDAAVTDEDEDDEKYKDILILDQGGMRLAVSFMEFPVPNGEAEHYAGANYMWPDAVDTVRGHKAQILIAVTGGNTNPYDCGQLFTKAVSSCLLQKHALAVYTDGAVFQPEFYRDFAMEMKEGRIPIIDWVWFGVYQDGAQAGLYTYGMKKFGKDEMEVYGKPGQADLNEIHGFLIDIASYVLTNDITLNDGETIGFTEDEHLSITRSKGIALEGQTLKIGFCNSSIFH